MKVEMPIPAKVIHTVIPYILHKNNAKSEIKGL